MGQTMPWWLLWQADSGNKSKDLLQLLKAVVTLYPTAYLHLTQSAKHSPERTRLMHPIVALDCLVKQAQAPAFLQALMKRCKGGALHIERWSGAGTSEVLT